MSQHIGSRLDDFLEEEELLTEADAAAAKRMIAWQRERQVRSTQEFAEQSGSYKTRE